MAQACTQRTNHYPRGVASGSRPADTSSLLVELVRTLRPAPPVGDAPAADARATVLLAELLAAHGRNWAALESPELVTMELTLRNDRVHVRVEPTDGFKPALEVHFDQTGKLLTWQSWSAEPLLTFQDE
jgi:hypothetical protein